MSEMLFQELQAQHTTDVLYFTEQIGKRKMKTRFDTCTKEWKFTQITGGASGMFCPLFRSHQYASTNS